MTIAPLGPEHVQALQRFFAELPEGDLTFIKEDVDAATVASWPDQPGRRWVALGEEGGVVGIVVVIPLSGWSDHVGEVRLVVAPQHRGAGLGRALARHALLQAVGMGLSKLVIEVVAQQESAAAMFTALGFEGEALLRDHIRDRSGRPRDLMMLAYYVQDTWSSMASIGLAEELGGAAGAVAGATSEARPVD